MTYKDKLLNPRWQKKRLEVLQRDDFTCLKCKSKENTLHVHHNYYDDTQIIEPWDYPTDSLFTLCDKCHPEEQLLMKEEIHLLSQFLKMEGFMSQDVDKLRCRLSDIHTECNINLLVFLDSIINDEKIINAIKEKHLNKIKSV